MAVEGFGNNSAGVAFLVSAGVQYEIIAAACSSPQTTELNAAARANTLMKWVHLGVAQGILFAGVAALIDRPLWKPITAGSALAIGLLYLQYVHARNAGLDSDQPPTETYEQPAAAAQPAAQPGVL